MKQVPIVFSFDNNLVFPAGICISSLLENANADTYYVIYIMYPQTQGLRKDSLERLHEKYSNFEIRYVEVGDIFDDAFEIRGITMPAYYRLLIPELIPEWDTILYSDVDVIFRKDLSDIYFNTDLDGCYFGGVRSCADMHSHGREYYGDKMGLDPAKTICSGNLIINSRLIRQDGMVEKFKALVPNKYHFQDQDVINIACRGKIKFLPPWYCLFTSFTKYTIDRRDELKEKYTEEEICDALDNGIVHYNGTKPWVAYCPNMDIWWEYYRKSIYFDHAYYFDFYFSKIDELDRMPFMKRLKLLVRYFTFGQTK